MCARTTVRARGAFALALCAGTVIAGTALAASQTEQADALIEQGVKLRVEGKPAEALDLFTKAHAIAPSARTLAQIGLAEGSLRQWTEAETHLEAALATHDTPWIENHRNREALEQALASIRGHIGHITVLGPEGADVSVEGRPVGRLPLAAPLRLPEGDARIEGTAPGRKSAIARVTVLGGTESTVALDLPPTIPQAPILPADVPEEASAPGSSRWMTWTGASLLGLSAAALTTGIVWFAVDGHPACDPPAGGTCYWVRDTKTQGWIAVAGAATLGVAGGILLWKGESSETRLSLGLGTLTASGHF